MTGYWAGDGNILECLLSTNSSLSGLLISSDEIIARVCQFTPHIINDSNVPASLIPSRFMSQPGIEIKDLRTTFIWFWLQYCITADAAVLATAKDK